MFKKNVYSLILFLLPLFSLAQSTDEKLANQYFNDYEYDKAVIYYQKLYNSQHKKYYYEKLLSCYTKLNDWKAAQKLIKKQYKIDPFDLSVLVDEGVVYNEMGEPKKANQSFDKAIKSIGFDQNQVTQLATAFIKNGMNEYALKTYDRAQKIYNGYPYNLEKAQVYQIMGNYDLMIKEYLDLLLINEAYVANVQNALQTTIGDGADDTKKQLLKSALIKYIQKHPDKEVFSEMLIWYYIQEKNFNGAFIQAKALDKRHKEGGRRLSALAKMAVSNNQFDVAIKCYQYIVDLGENAAYYFLAKMELVNVFYYKVTETNNYTNEELVELEKLFENTLNEIGRNNSSTPLIKNLAHLQAFYLHKTDEAIKNLEFIINLANIEKHEQAEAKIELADVYLLTGDVWEASLLYSQVEKAFKYDQLGETAKFKNAKISFYTGDFSWAKAQLDALKASTSKLIANDAMQLSLIITDNLANDTASEPLIWYAKADLLAFQNKYDEALQVLDSIDQFFPYHDIADNVLYKRYEIYAKQHNYEKAAEQLQKIVVDFGEDVLGDDALFNLAELYEYNLNDKEKAAELYKQLLFAYKGSVYVVEARKRYRSLKKEIEIIDIKDDTLYFKEN